MVGLTGCGGAPVRFPTASDLPTTSSAPSRFLSPQQGIFGAPVRLASGLTLLVTQQGPFEPSKFAVKPKARVYQRFQIELRNRSGDLFNPSLVEVVLTDGQGAAQQVLDNETGLNGSPRARIQPGLITRWDVAFGVRTRVYVLRVALNDRQGEVIDFSAR